MSQLLGKQLGQLFYTVWNVAARLVQCQVDKLLETPGGSRRAATLEAIWDSRTREKNEIIRMRFAFVLQCPIETMNPLHLEVDRNHDPDNDQ